MFCGIGTRTETGNTIRYYALCKKYTLLFFSLLIFPLLYYCGGDKDPRSKIETRTWEAMGTQISISLCSDDKNRQAALFDEISSRIIHLEQYSVLIWLILSLINLTISL
jgi:hypothetical protein